MSAKSAMQQRKLVELIFSLHSFSENELIAKFNRMTRGDMSIGQGQTIKNYLTELIEIGTLRYEYGRYRVASK